MTALFWFLAVLFQVGTAACPPGWTYLAQTRNCYRYFYDYITYFQATDRCKAEGGVIATIKSPEEMSLVFSMSQDPYWIGLDDLETDGTYRWQDGSKVVYTNWKTGNPYVTQTKNCVAIGYSMKFELTDCNDDYNQQYACQIPSTSDPCDGYTCENSGVCNSATGVAVCECSTGYTGERCEKLKTVSYEVIAFTSDVDAADTDASVYIRITGESGTSFEKLLDNESVNDFQRGHTDTFAFTAADVGKINTVMIWHDNSSYEPGWHLGYVTVRKYEYESSAYVDYTFNCDCWLDEDGTLSRTLENPKVSSSA